jgi:hypothetical protein
MANTDLAIKIATTLDATGLNKADKAVNKFNRTVGRLGRNLGLALGTTAIIAYGKASVKAFAADEAAAKRLSTAVDNLGLSLSQSRVTSFVKDLETSSAIADDVLRPALQALLTTTGSLTKSQELLSNAIQISRASGIDLATVSEDLAKGFVGVTRGLRKYNTGLTQAELKSKSFNEILGIMLARSAGAAEEYLTTTSYKMEVLALAAGNAQETIGEGLVDALARIGGGTEASDAAKSIDNIANATSNLIKFLGSAIGLVEKFRKNYTNFLAGGDVDVLRAGKQPTTNRSSSTAGTAARIAQQRQAEIAAAKRAKELEALTKKQVASQKALTAEQKKQAALKKAGSIFDLDQIQLIAALKGKLSDEDRKRVELQFALITGNTKQATALTLEIAKAQGLGKDLAEYLANIPDAKNPFASWEAYLDMLMAKAQKVASLGAGVSASAAVSSMPTATERNQIFGTTPTNVPTPIERNQIFGTTPTRTSGMGQASTYVGGTPIYVQIDGKTIASALQDSSLSGIGSSVNRTGR